jgi:uncharacterized protein YPO0396
LRWLLALAVPLFAGGIAWLVKHLSGREAQLVQLGLQRAQTDAQRATVEEIRARVKREDETSAVSNLRLGMQELRADVERLRNERDAADGRVGELLIERQELRIQVEHLETTLKAAEEQIENFKARRTLGGNGKGN